MTGELVNLMSHAQGLPRTAVDWVKRLSPPNPQKRGDLMVTREARL